MQNKQIIAICTDIIQIYDGPDYNEMLEKFYLKLKIKN